ncbi:hypothetical protein WH5701_09284 [Synechococcus sp. WH 5701]|nr:hypothetical protein WH5701_09284 [Synechococcus sp. WH 5701]
MYVPPEALHDAAHELEILTIEFWPSPYPSWLPILIH